jgi:hypothetical protein
MVKRSAEHLTSLAMGALVRRVSCCATSVIAACFFWIYHVPCAGPATFVLQAFGQNLLPSLELPCPLRAEWVENLLAANRAKRAQKLALPGDRQESAWTGCNDDRDSRVDGSRHIYSCLALPCSENRLVRWLLAGGRYVTVVANRDTAVQRRRKPLRADGRNLLRAESDRGNHSPSTSLTSKGSASSGLCIIH